MRLQHHRLHAAGERAVMTRRGGSQGGARRRSGDGLKLACSERRLWSRSATDGPATTGSLGHLRASSRLASALTSALGDVERPEQSLASVASVALDPRDTAPPGDLRARLRRWHARTPVWWKRSASRACGRRNLPLLSVSTVRHVWWRRSAGRACALPWVVASMPRSTVAGVTARGTGLLRTFRRCGCHGRRLCGLRVRRWTVPVGR
jgi:hypothetical protein